MSTWIDNYNYVAYTFLDILTDKLAPFKKFDMSYSSELAASPKKGTSMRIPVRQAQEAVSFSGTNVFTGFDETPATISIDDHFTIPRSLTSSELTFSLNYAEKRIIEPCVAGMVQKIASFAASAYKQIPNYVGTAGSPPDTTDKLLAVSERLDETNTPDDGERYAILNSSAKAKLVGIPEIRSAYAYGTNRDLMNYSLSTFAGINWDWSNAVQKHTAGTFTVATTATAGTAAVGATTITISGGTGTNTLVKGDVFTVTTAGGFTDQYVVTANATATAGVITVTVSPSVKHAITSGDAVSFVGDHVANFAFHKNAIALNLVTPEGVRDREEFKIYGANSGYGIVDRDGIGIRLARNFNIVNMQHELVFDIFAGVNVIAPEQTCRILG